jgi:tRNA pseudouridine38-40 synthase
MRASRVLRMTLEYDGTSYHGFAIQPGLPTIQGVVERGLTQILGAATRVTPAGRTDAGVHAKGQVISFQTDSCRPAQTIGRGLNALLPDDIAVVACNDASPSFDARRSAVRRHYRYSVWNDARPSVWWRDYALHAPGSFDVEAMNVAAAALVGRHDFSSFVGHASQEPAATSAVRSVERAEWNRRGGLLHFFCSGNAFARHMVRGMAGTLLWVGRGRLSPQEFGQVLAARDRRAAGPNAPARGLMLVAVDYEEETCL